MIPPLAAGAAPEDRDPEVGGMRASNQAVVAKKFMVSAANPLASKAGYRILAKGGSAIDAAIAIQAVLNLVEPQSSGIGGGTFILHWDNQKHQIQTFDGRETAPAADTPDIFLGKDKKARPWIEMVVGGKSVGVPGVLKALFKAHQQHGKLPWGSLFDDAIKLAEEGFDVSPRMALQLQRRLNPGVEKFAASRAYFAPDGHFVKAGHHLVNKPYARILREIAKAGPDAFYLGDNAKAIVDTVNKAAINPGKITLKDLADYQAKERPALCGEYHGYKICGMGPPSSGGFTVLQILSLLEPFKLAQYQPNQAQAIQLYTQASRLAYADRNRYLADSDFVEVPLKALLAPDYMAKRSKLIDIKKDMGPAKPGLTDLYAYSDDDALELPCTSHFSIVDAQGNAISMTTSIEHAFGSGLMVNGYLLNNQLTDFSFNPTKNGKPVANRVEGNKRPRSSMAPMMIFDRQGKLKMLIGSPGGSRIIGYVAQTIVAVLDWGMDMQQAIALPHVTNRNDVTDLEAQTEAVSLKPALEKLGHTVVIRQLNSGLHGIFIDKGQLHGGADPRREGVVLGQ